MSKKNKVPARWTEYKNVGERVAGTRFLPFKVPLKESICSRMEEKYWFTTSMLMENVPNLELVIDLTFTDRYYCADDLKDNRIDIENIKCPGGPNQVPSNYLVQRFFSVVDDFLTSREANDKDSLIGVHCTHGLNRTGYFICKYMINRMGMKPDQAIEAFERARGHKIERNMLLNDLRNSGRLALGPTTTSMLSPLSSCYDDESTSRGSRYGRRK